MVIAAHVSWEYDPDNPLLTSLRIIAERNPGDRVILFSPEIIPAIENIIVDGSVPDQRDSLRMRYWYRYKLTRLLKKYKADSFISDAGMLGMKVGIPQFLFFADQSFEERKGFVFGKNLPASLAKAKAVFVTEDFIARILTEKHRVAADKIKTVYHGLDEDEREPVATAEMIRAKFTDGNDYFLYPVNPTSAPNCVLLLKAFSQLKKRQKTSMKIVLLHSGMDEEGLVPDFKNYRYRDDVKIISTEEKNAQLLTAHAYGLIWLSDYFPGNEAFRAMQHKVPLIAEDNETNKSLFGNAALFSALSQNELADKMQLLYKDELLKKSVSDHAPGWLLKYDAMKAADALLNGISA